MENLGGLSAIMTIMSIMSEYAMWNEDYYRQDEWLNEQRDFQAEREDVAWHRNVNSDVDRAEAMMSQGWNPNIVANSLLGGNSSTPASSSPAPTAPNIESAMSAMASMLGKSMDNVLDVERKASETQKNQSVANKNDVEAGIMPRDFQLRRMSTAAQINAWESSAKLACRQADYNEELTKLVKNQNLYYGRLTEAQIEAYRSQVRQASADAMLKLEQIKTEEKKQTNLDTESAVNIAKEQNVRANTILQYTEQSTEYYRSERERIAKEFEEKLGGVPLTADAQKYVNKLAEDGNYQAVENFYNTIFTTSLNQHLGAGQGDYWTTPDWSIGLPFGIANMKGSMPVTGQYKRGNYIMPYWNPQLK